MTSTIIRNPLFKAGHIYEVRILDTPQGTVSGYFDNEVALNAAVAPWDGKVKAIYVTMNPVRPDLFSRAPNRLVKRSAVTTADPDILNREWLLIDLDVTRPKNTSSTEAEHQAALEKAITIQQWLTEQEWPEPIVCDSGNGTHLLYAIDIPNTAASTQTIKAILKGLAERFDDAMVKLDTSVHNASRITKLYGTMACKGENTPDRPHRRSTILSQPVLEAPTVVTATQLEALVTQTTQTKAATQTTPGTALDMRAFLTRHQLEVTREKPWDDGGTLFELAACPFEPSHAGTASIMQFANGAIAFRCLHSSCDGHDWTALGAHLNARRLQTALTELRALSPEEIRVRWPSYIEDLDAVAGQTLLNEVAKLTDVGINTLKRAVKEQRDQTKRDATRTRIGRRLSIPYYPEDVSSMAEQVEQATLAQTTDFELLSYAGILMRVVVEPLPLAHEADGERLPVPTAHLDPLTRTKLLPLVERAVVFQMGPHPIGVPAKILDHLLVNSSRIPQVSALVTHPVVTHAGRIISAQGIDLRTGLLLYGAPVDKLRPYSQAQARKAVDKLVAWFLDGFEFATDLDRACALGMLLTAVVRKMLPESPGFLITAAQQSVGKTTLARRTHLVLTGRDVPILTWPGEHDETETNKLLLSTLLRCPPMICFDNVGDGLTFRSPALAAAMTSATKEGRILGVSQNAVVPTSVLFVLTGNNTELANDEVWRWIRVRLTSNNVNPHHRTFANPDVHDHALSIREEVLRHCVGIVAGYRQGGERLLRKSRFGAWDDLVRQPLLWAGVKEDIGTAFDANIEASPELGAHLTLLTELYQKFPNKKPFSANDVIKTYDRTFDLHPLKEALLALHSKDPNNDRSVGHVLAKACGRKVQVDGVTIGLQQRLINGLTRYWVEEVG